MAIQKSTRALRANPFPAPSVGETGGSSDIPYLIENKLSQLRSLLLSMHGAGGEGFETIDPNKRDNLV